MPAPLSNVNVVSSGDQLVVTWRGGGESLSIFVSLDPDDAGVNVFAPDSPGVAIVPIGGVKRPYVHLFDPHTGFVVAAERRLEMDGPRNFRDLGGYRSASGGNTRWGRVFRSDRLDAMSDEDHVRVLDLGITKIFDLRVDAEVDDAPDRLPEGVELVRLPMSSDGVQARTIMERIEVGELTKFGQPEMSTGYLVMLDEFTDHISTVAAAVAAGERVLFHCTAGKDRTGVMAMVLLSMCGVDAGDVLDDYELTNSYAPPHGPQFSTALQAMGLEPREFETLWMAPRGVMRAVLEGMQDRWDSFDGYLRFAGITKSASEAVRRQMLYDRQND